MFLHILKYKILAFIHTDFDFSPNKLFRKTGSILIYALFAIGAFYFTKNIIEYVLVTQKIGLFLLHEFISILLFIFFMAVHVGNIIVSYSTLFKSSEVQYLFTKPLKPGLIFSIKFLDNFFYSSTTLILILFAVFAGYADYFNLGIVNFITILVFNIVPFLISAGALGVIVLLVVLKFAKHLGLRRVFFVLSVLYLTSLITFFKMASPVQLVNEVFKHYPEVNQYFFDLIPHYLRYLPNHWLSDNLFWLVNGKFEQALHPMIWQITLAVIFIFIALVLGAKWYHSLWLTSFGSSKSKRQDKSSAVKNLFNRKSLFRPQTEVLLKKDLLTFIREPSQVIHLAILILLILLFISSVSSVTLLGSYSYYIQSIVYMTVFLFNALLIATLSLRFVYPLISLEGIAFWKIGSSPVNLHKYIFSRLIPYMLIIFFVAQILSYFSNYQFSFQLKLFSALITTMIVPGLVMLNFCLGAHFADYHEKNPIRVASSQGASITFLGSLILLVALVAGLFRPLFMYFENYIRFGLHNLDALLNVSFVIGLISFLICIISYQITLQSLKRDFK